MRSAAPQGLLLNAAPAMVSRTNRASGSNQLLSTRNARIEALVRAHGRTTFSFQALGRDLQHWLDGDAAIAYADTGGAWIGVGNPLAARGRDEEMMTRFALAGAGEGKRVCFFGAEGGARAGSTWAWLKVGEQPIWDPQRWPTGLGKRVRGQIRRALNKREVIPRQVSAQELAHQQGGTRESLDSAIAAWLASRRMAPMGFVAGIDPHHLASERRFFVAERGSEVVAALIAVPIYARNGWFIDSMPRRPGAPNGAVEVLFDHAMRSLSDEGSTHVSFGVCPLMNVPSPFLAALRHVCGGFYNFGGLQRFKSKLMPDAWQSVYVVHPKGESLLRVAVDTARVFTPTGLLRFAWDTGRLAVKNP